MKTGYKRLDKLLGGGLKKGEVTIIAGRPSMFKRTLALNIAYGLAGNFYKTLIFSTQYSEKIISDTINKICANETIGADRVVIKVRDMFAINDHSYLTPSYIENQLDDISQKKRDISAVIIHSFNDIFCDNWSNLARQTYSDKQTNRNIVMNELRRIARDRNIAIILCVNLDRELETRNDHRPTIEDLSRIIDAGCFPDNVIFTYRDSLYMSELEDKNKEIDWDKVDVKVALSRSSQCDKITYRYDKETHKLLEEKK